MTTNKLKLNQDKTELLFFSSKYSPQKIIPSLQFGSEIIKPSTHARNIGVIFDTHLTMACHINNICKSSFYHLRNIAKIRKFISFQTTETLVHSFVSSKLDNCNSLLLGLPNKLLEKLQFVQNAAAKVINLSRKQEHVTPILINLHWLPIKSRIEYKTLLLTFKALHGLSPVYIQDLISRYKPKRNLRSSSQLLLTAQSYNLESYGHRSFSVAAPELWNSLPMSIRHSSSLASFKSELKTHLFKLAYSL